MDAVAELAERLRADRVEAVRLPSPRRRRAVREAAGASLRACAEAIGVDPMTLLRWERGTTVPRPDHAVAYRRLLDALEGVAQ